MSFVDLFTTENVEITEEELERDEYFGEKEKKEEILQEIKDPDNINKILKEELKKENLFEYKSVEEPKVVCKIVKVTDEKDPRPTAYECPTCEGIFHLPPKTRTECSPVESDHRYSCHICGEELGYLGE